MTEYQPGAAIGWHRDGPPFGMVIGVALVSSCKVRLRPVGGGRDDTRTIVLEPRSMPRLRRPGAIGMGTQHPVGEWAALLDHLQDVTIARKAGLTPEHFAVSDSSSDGGRR